MSGPPSVHVQGTATVAALPDRASLGLTVSHLAADRATALAEVSSRADAVTAVLRASGLDESAWRTSGVQIGPEYSWTGDRRVLTGHRAVAQFTLVVRDRFDVLDSIVDGAVARGDADVSGPEWSVSPDHPARREACTLAALDARGRAGAYAEALDLRLGPVVHIDERLSEPARPRPMMARAMAEPAGETIHVGTIDVDATVTVEFALLEGSS